MTSWVAGLALSICLLLLASAPAQADKVGVAAAVEPDAFSSLSGTPNKQLNIGKSIFYNERINTTGSGLVQVLLVDGSTFTVGPNSNLVIDKFVYDPNKKAGSLVATFSKGSMRFIGGKLSKNDGGVTVNTPAGALAIRGGMFQTNGKVYSFLFGEHMTLSGRNGRTYTVYQPGNSIDTTGGTPTIRPTTAADINSVMGQLTNGNTVPINNTTPSETTPKYTQVDTLSLQDLISDANQTQIQDSLQKDETTTPPGTTPTVTPTTPIPINARVLSPPNQFSAFGASYPNPSENGILGGDSRDYVNADDFIWTFDLGTGRFKGIVTGLNDGSGSFLPATVDFPFVGLPGSDGIFVIDPAAKATITQAGQKTTYVGYVVVKPDFFAYDVVASEASEDHPDRLLVFGGKGYNFGTPSGKIYSFNLTPDTIENGAFGPFASTNSSPVPAAFTGLQTYTDPNTEQSLGVGYVSPLVLLEKDGGPQDQSHAVWMQTNFFVGDGDNKGSSFINVALGEWDPQTGITGFRRGGSIVLGPEGDTENTYSFSGDIASLAGPDSNGTLSHFMGSANPNIVIGADTTGTGDHTIFRDTPLSPTDFNDTVQEQSGATYHVGVGQVTDLQHTQTLDSLSGFAAGFAGHPDGSSDYVANFSPSDVTLTFDATTNTMTGTFKLQEVDASLGGVIDSLLNRNPQFNLGFGGDGRSAFLDDNTFAAIEATSGSSVSTSYGLFGHFTDHDPAVEGFIVSADAIQANAILFPGQMVQNPANPEGPLVQKRAFCQNCEFIKWGAWGARVDYQQHNGQTATADVPLGWWIAGDVVNKNDMPTSAISATYRGDAIGNVETGGNQYTATGKMDMTWYFRPRTGTLNITDFDNRDYTFGLGAKRSSPQFFQGGLVKPGWIGAANGAFVGPNGGHAPNGVIGNFGVGRNGYQATGIFGGVRQ